MWIPKLVTRCLITSTRTFQAPSSSISTDSQLVNAITQVKLRTVTITGNRRHDSADWINQSNFSCTEPSTEPSIQSKPCDAHNCPLHTLDWVAIALQSSAASHLSIASLRL